MPDEYSDAIIDHFENPRNMGEIDDPDGIGDAGNPLCGDLTRITMRIDDRGETITDIKFKASGCPAAIASSSAVTELVKGRTIKQALEVSNEQVAQRLGGLPPEKLHCSVLAEQGIALALMDYYRKHPEKDMPSELHEKVSTLMWMDPWEGMDAAGPQERSEQAGHKR